MLLIKILSGKCLFSLKKKIFRDLKSRHKELKRVEIPEVDLDKLIELGY